jgi:hypothetical protein
VEAKNVGILLGFLTSVFMIASTTAQELTIDEFAVIVKACADSKVIPLSGNLSTDIHNIYSDQTKRTSLSSLGQFLLNLPDAERPDAYKLYSDCIAQLFFKATATVPAAPSSPPATAPVIVTYKVCTGEYQQACPPHDAYLYCYANLNAWATSRCTSFTTSRVSVYGGNKCGYSLDTVVCTGPR